MKRRKWVQAILFTAAMLLCAAQANAALVTIQFSGHVTSARGTGLPDTIKIGDIFTGTYTYDTATPNTDAAPNRGQYQHSAPCGISITLGGYEFKTSPDSGFTMQIWDDFVDGSGRKYDFYYILSNQNAPLPVASSYVMSWTLYDNTHMAISSIALPATAPILSDWTSNGLQISYGNSLLIAGTVTFAALVPEPITGMLMLVGTLFVLRRH